MKKLNEETVLNLSKNQLQSVINNHLSKESRLNDMFAMMINGLMLSERSAFLVENNNWQKKRRS